MWLPMLIALRWLASAVALSVLTGCVGRDDGPSPLDDSNGRNTVPTDLTEPTANESENKGAAAPNRTFYWNLTSPRWKEFVAGDIENASSPGSPSPWEPRVSGERREWPVIPLGETERITLTAKTIGENRTHTLQLRFVISGGFEVVGEDAEYYGPITTEGESIEITIRAAQVGEWFVGGIVSPDRDSTTPTTEIAFRVE